MSGRRNALVVGATGLVGGRLLDRLIGDDRYVVTTLGRRAPAVGHEGVTHLVSDFADPASPLTVTVDVLFCCLGTTIKTAGSRSAFRAVDFDLVVNLARAAATAGAGTVIVVSSVDADPGSGNFYCRTKGEMEQAVGTIGFARCGFLRPSLLLGARDEFRPLEAVGKLAARLVSPVMAGPLAKYRGVDAGTVAGAMIGLDQQPFAGTRIIEGRDIPRLDAASGRPRV